MAYSAFDPVMSGFEQPMTMTPAGQRRAYVGQQPSATPRVSVAVDSTPGPVNLAGQVVGDPALGIMSGGIPAIAPAVTGALGALGVAMPAWLMAALGVAATGYAGYQALGGGEGGGLFGLNILGGDEFAMGGLEFGGPGLPEPTAPYSEWHVGNKQFYYVKQYNTSGSFKGAKVAMYNKDTKRWKVWSLPKPHLAVIGKNQPSHRMITRLRRNLSRHTADAKTLISVTSPAWYAKMHGYHKHKK